METGSPVKEFTSDELDALAAAELPVQDAPIPPNASTAVAASATIAPEQTGSPELIAGEGVSSAYGNRPDGSKKGLGWLGEIQLANGGIATEYTVQSDAVQQGGRRIDFPTLVPTLSAEEVAILKDDIIPNGKAVPEPIMQKAIKHANEQILKNRSVFAEETNKTKEPEVVPSPVAQIEAGREYTTEEIDLLDQVEKAKEFTSDDLDQKIVASVYDDPTYIPTRDEYFQAKELKARLKSEGKIPGLLENAATGAGQFLQTLGTTYHEIVDDPGEFLATSPATLKATAKKSWRNTNDVMRWIRQANAPEPIGRDEQTGEFVYGTTGRSAEESLAGQQMLAAEQGRSIRPVTPEDLKDEEFDRFVMERSRQKELEEWVANTTAPTEFVTSLVTGRNQTEQPMQATSDIAGGLIEPTNIATMAIPFGAGAKTLGASRLAKQVGAGGARIMERAAARGIEGMEAGAARFQEIIQKSTRISPENQVKIAKWSAAGGIGGGVFGLDTDVPVLSQAQDAARFIGGAYVGYKLGLGTLRNVQKVAGPTSTILRVAANPAEGFDDIAQASVAAKLNAFPELSPVREVLENPTRFRPIESTPARLAADPRLGPQTRAVADALSNPLIVQGVRGTSAVASGAVKGAAANAPFVALALNADEEKAAANMLGLGAGFGAFGGAVNRFTGLQQRRAEARASDTARMFMDVELAGGDVAKLAQTYSPQQLGDLASMQGFFRDKVQFVPLNKADFDTNTQALGGAGAAGLFVQAPPGEKARVFLNLEAQRDGIVPHELGHALIKSGALGSAQADAIRAFTTRRYTQAGVESRAREYATAIIQNENAAKFPGQNLPVSAASITAKIDELGQSGMLRGDIDPLDWARDEIFAEDFRQASQSMDFAAIRRNLPADGSWLGSMENLLGAQANALSISGVRIDPVTGQPDPLFKANPILATDPVLKKQLGQYLNNYRDWINHPDQTKARGVRVAPAARPQDLVNNPQVTFHDYGGGVMANEFARIDPATGQAVFRDQRDINAETAKRQQQVKALAGSKLMPATDPNLGPKKTADGRVTVRGRILPQQFDFLNGFAQHQRAFARQFETAAANGESMMTRYHAIGSGDTGAFRIKNLGNLEAITREVIPWGWELSGKGNLLASVLDLTQFRNRAIKAINAGDPTIGRLYNNDLRAIETDLKQWMDNHRQDLPGSNKIGEQRRDAINSLIGIATNINKAANPFSGKIAGPSSAIKQFRLDRLDTTTPTGRTGFHFDYDKANGNLFPEVATPLPNLSRDLPTGQAMPDAKPLKPIEQMTDRQLSFFLRKHGEQPSSALDVARRWSDGDRMWGAHEMGDELSLSPITDMNDLSGYSRDRLISLPKATEDALYNPQGQAMPDAGRDKISSALPRRSATVSGKAEVSNDGTITYKGKEPAQWSPQEFEAFGKEFGVRNLGPISKISNIVDELGRPVAQIPGGLEGKFTYYDLLHLKANAVDVRTLPVDLHGQLTAKLARTMTPDRGNKVQKFNGILFGMLSPNSPLLPNEFGQARMRFGSMDEIKKFADLLPDNPTKDQRKAVNERLKKELGFTAAKSGGLGIGISVDLSNIVIAAKMFHKNPDFFIKKPKESWANFVDKLTTQVSGLGTKTASFGGVWQDPLNAGISAMDRHMARAFSDELLNNPDIRGRFEGIVVKRFNDLVTESKDTARKADAKIRRAKTEKAKAAAEQEKATAMQNLPDPTALKADTLDDVLGQAEIFGADRVKDFVNEAVFAAMGSRKAKYQMKDGSVNPNLPASIQGVEWVQTPKDFQVMSEAYRLALEINAERAKSIGIEIFPAQWTLWDRIRGRVEPHEAMFPGLEKIPALNDRQLASAFAANKKAGYASTPAPGQPWKRKSGINPAELAYFGIPIAAAAVSQQDEE